MNPIPHLSYTLAPSNFLYIRLDGNEWYDRDKAAELRKELNALNPMFKTSWGIRLDDHSYVEAVVYMQLQDELHAIMMEMELNDMGIFPWRCHLSMRHRHGYCEEDLADA
jgi:hypothetical protein